jgi:hypothetical protein
MARSGVNKRAIAQLTRDIQREFDKHPIHMPIEAADNVTGRLVGATNFYGPVINVNGDRAQLAWGNESVVQNQGANEEIAPGFEGITQAVVSILHELGGAGLSTEDQEMAEQTAHEVLAEVVKEPPDRSVMRRCVNVLKGLLSPIALGAAAGAGQGAEEWARTAIEQLGTPF